MKITLDYNDATSLLASEVVQNAKHIFGDNVRVHVSPDSSAPNDIIYFGIQQLITSEHLSILFDSDMYQTDLRNLRASALATITNILDQVIIDNETKVT